MSRIGTKKPPIKNAYYAPQEHVPSMHGYAVTEYAKANLFNVSNNAKDIYKSSHSEKTR